MHTHRKLLVLGLNEAVERGDISLTKAETEGGSFVCMLAGRPAFVGWRPIGWEETTLTVRWDYDEVEVFPSTRLIPKGMRPYLRWNAGAVANGWLERKTGIYLQGKGKGGMFDLYSRRGILSELRMMPDPIALGFEIEGPVRL